MVFFTLFQEAIRLRSIRTFIFSSKPTVIFLGKKRNVKNNEMEKVFLAKNEKEEETI